MNLNETMNQSFVVRGRILTLLTARGNKDGNEDERRYDRLGLEGEVQSLILGQRGGSE